MPPRTIEGTPEEWARVGETIRERRLALGRPQGPRPSNKVWSQIETGKPENYRITEQSERQICDALSWGPGCIQQLLRGEEPEEAVEEEAPSPQEDRLARLEARVEAAIELIRDLARQIAEQGGTRPGGPAGSSTAP